jgi:hypothetical protein
MGVGVFARLQHTPGIRQWDPEAENWVPICASIWDPDPSWVPLSPAKWGVISTAAETAAARLATWETSPPGSTFIYCWKRAIRSRV